MNNERGRAIEVGKLLVDPKSGLVKRFDNPEQLHLTPKQLTLLRVLDQENYINVPDIAFKYEMASTLNKAMLIATSKLRNKNTDTRHKAIDLLDELDNKYTYCNSKRLKTSDDLVRVQIDKLRKMFGNDIIHNRNRFGYRIASKDSVL